MGTYGDRIHPTTSAAGRLANLCCWTVRGFPSSHSLQEGFSEKTSLWLIGRPPRMASSVKPYMWKFWVKRNRKF